MVRSSDAWLIWSVLAIQAIGSACMFVYGPVKGLGALVMINAPFVTEKRVIEKPGPVFIITVLGETTAFAATKRLLSIVSCTIVPEKGKPVGPRVTPGGVPSVASPANIGRRIGLVVLNGLLNGPVPPIGMPPGPLGLLVGIPWERPKPPPT